MKLIDRVDTSDRGNPFTAEEIDHHEDSKRIWATVAQCKREAQEACQSAWGDGYWKGLHANRYDKG